MPHTISIESKNFLKYISDKAKTISVYFENQKTFYDDMPDNLLGKLLKRSNVIDFMDFTPSCLSLVAVVSNNIRSCLNLFIISCKSVG